MVSCHTHVFYIKNIFLCAQWFPVILVYCRFSTHSYVLGGFLSYSCTLDLVHIPMCSMVSCHTHVFYIKNTFLCARWLPVILVYFIISTHSYVLGGYLLYSCTLDLVTFLCARWFPVILVYFRVSTHSYVLAGFLSYSCTLDLVHISMCSVDTCHTRVL